MKINGLIVPKFPKLTFILLVLFTLNIHFYAQSSVVKVDFSLAGRPPAEVDEPGYTPWLISPAASSSQTIDGITFSLNYAGSGGTNLMSTWYKAGIQTPYYARLVSDGVTVENGTSGAEIRLTISGLATGAHTLLCYHNNVDNPASNTFSPVDVYIDGSLKINNLIPSVRATSTVAAVSSYLNFNATSGQNVVIRFVADSGSSANNKNIVINGFELDVADPAQQASSPIPENNDEHIDADSGSVTLKWTKAGSAVSHDVYVGTNEAELASATHASPLFKGNQSGTSYNLSGIIKTAIYYWRVDEVTSGGAVTKGNIWYFRPRQLAFPDAEGYGRFARGGRGGIVVHVTNLNDSGAGSLRAAVENNDLGPRTIVFDVAGIIKLESRLVLNNRYVTVAGQTAPGKGIVIRSAPFGTSGARDIIIQDVRVRLGAGLTFDGMGMAGSDYCIIDHCSISWSIDESFSSRNGKNITLQRTLISEALNVAGHVNYPAGSAHGFAATISGDIGSFHHNLLAHNAGRNWSLGGGLDGNGLFAGRVDIFNNVVYNWDYRTTDGGAHEVNFVNNYYKPGAASSIFVALNAQYEDFPGTQQYYFKGNVMPGHFDENSQDKGRKTSGSPSGYSAWVSSPFFPSYAKIQTAKEAYKSVLSDVGCTQPVFDDHDIRVVKETLDGTYTYKGSKSGKPGLPDHENDVGGYESYPATSRASDWDTDKDGLPNWWETYYKLNTNSGSGNFADANADPDNDGYTNLDNYLQWMANPHYIINNSETVSINLKQTFVGYTSSPTYSVSDIVNGQVSISSGTAKFSPGPCAMASFTLKVSDSEGARMTKKFGVFISGNCSTTTATPSITPTPTVGGLKGDVNGDNSITIVDALMIAQHSVGLAPTGFIAARADVNCDGFITIVDALMCAQYYVGILSAFPC